MRVKTRSPVAIGEL